MSHRRWFIAILIFSAVFNAAAILRTLVPAQDGLKFLAAARRFQSDPWVDVVRGTDQHPLYPALIAAVEPLTAAILGPGPDAWRIAAQGVSATASLLLLLPLFALARAVFDGRVALIAVFVYVLLPVPGEVGRDTLSNALGLLGMTTTLQLGASAIRRDSWRLALAAGLAGGVAYLARPEAILAPMSVGLAFIAQLAKGRGLRAVATAPALPALGLAVLVCVGSYALAKGQVSEKLALRHAASLGSQAIAHRSSPQPLPPGLDRAGLDLSPKEESDERAIGGPLDVLKWVVRRWWDEMCWGFAIMTIWGLARRRAVQDVCGRQTDAGGPERLVLSVFVAAYVLVLMRHGSSLGYLSSRHILPLVVASTIWAGAGAFICVRGLGIKLAAPPRAYRAAVAVASAFIAVLLVGYQLRTGHESRRGHWEAGRWLLANAGTGEQVLDTRGWARFVADRPKGYDYWHVRQALSDRSLAYVVVGRDELEAKSPRAESLNALLAFAATPVRDFPVVVEGRDVGARIYRMNQPISWEGFTP
ncbi:glycosyltransferase family 39 protein [Paludisphaera soli]|uniref:glycosyltransferase family 39 protein n=1 Tax=Paludisphaera soli TaxID=2712865 RepID=UPI0013EA23FD|nr:glycosyltransferase family 39 protein [Paludisphaera soli]